MDHWQYLYPKMSYRGKFTPSNLVFNYNLQEFATKTSYIASLHTNAKMTPLEAYQQINSMFEQLESSYYGLNINE